MWGGTERFGLLFTCERVRGAKLFPLSFDGVNGSRDMLTFTQELASCARSPCKTIRSVIIESIEIMDVRPHFIAMKKEDEDEDGRGPCVCVGR